MCSDVFNISSLCWHVYVQYIIYAIISSYFSYPASNVLSPTPIVYRPCHPVLSLSVKFTEKKHVPRTFSEPASILNLVFNLLNYPRLG